MALVVEPGLLCNPRERLAGLAQQVFYTLQPTLDDIPLWSDAGCLFKRAAEVIGAETRDFGQYGEREVQRGVGGLT